MPDIYSRVHVGRYAGTLRPDPDAVVLGSTGDPDGQYRTVAVTVPQGTLVTSISLNPTNDTLASLRRVELIASLAVLLSMGVLVVVVVRRGLRPLRQMAGTADAIASGDLTRRVPEGRPDTEVGRLGVALNEMLTQIEGVRREVGLRGSPPPVRGRRIARAADAPHLHPGLRGAAGAGWFGRGGAAQGAKRIEEESTRMGGLVEDLLLLAELDRGRPLRAEPVDLQRICADAVGDSNAVAHGHHLMLAPGPPVVVLGDGERLAQVAQASWATRWRTPPGTEVTVSTGVENDMGFIEVSDNGPGIPPPESARVFDRFYQGDPSRSAWAPGWGWPSCAPSPRPCTGRPRWSRRRARVGGAPCWSGSRSPRPLVRARRTPAPEPVRRRGTPTPARSPQLH